MYVCMGGGGGGGRDDEGRLKWEVTFIASPPHTRRVRLNQMADVEQDFLSEPTHLCFMTTNRLEEIILRVNNSTK